MVMPLTDSRSASHGRPPTLLIGLSLGLLAAAVIVLFASSHHVAAGVVAVIALLALGLLAYLARQQQAGGPRPGPVGQ